MLEDDKILSYLQGRKKPANTNVIAAATSLPRGQARDALTRLMQAGKVRWFEAQKTWAAASASDTTSDELTPPELTRGLAGEALPPLTEGAPSLVVSSAEPSPDEELPPEVDVDEPSPDSSGDDSPAAAAADEPPPHSSSAHQPYWFGTELGEYDPRTLHAAMVGRVWVNAREVVRDLRRCGADNLSMMNELGRLRGRAREVLDDLGLTHDIVGILTGHSSTEVRPYGQDLRVTFFDVEGLPRLYQQVNEVLESSSDEEDLVLQPIRLQRLASLLPMVPAGELLCLVRGERYMSWGSSGFDLVRL